jgi:DNA-binding NtrC family response regulator
VVELVTCLVKHLSFMREKTTWLVAWIGKTDHEASEGVSIATQGPIAGALLGSHRFDKVYLLTNYPHARSVVFCTWLEKITGYLPDQVELYDIDLPSPIDYAAIYAEVCSNLLAARLPSEDVELTFHLSPGTPAMAAIWIILSKTRFPARLIQTSRERGIESVDFEFDLASDFLPEFLERSSARIERLSASPVGAVAQEFAAIVHQSTVMRKQIELARRVAVYDVPVLILGESGTGKELFAEAIHAANPKRANHLFVAVNCGAIPTDLANSELFGHVKGAFTGAVKSHDGFFTQADGGTLFLDEIGDLPLDSQVRLLRVLQNKEVTPVGSGTARKVNVRIVAATHRDLAADVADGRFREDLFHRLAVGILRLPPLRERSGDLDMLIDLFLRTFNDDALDRPEAQQKVLSMAGRQLLHAHGWPGNVRELQHTLLRAAIWSPGETIDAGDVKSAILPVHRNSDAILNQPIAQGVDLQRLLDCVARHYVERALIHTGHRKAAAAKLLGLSNHQTLQNWIKRLGVEQGEFDE